MLEGMLKTDLNIITSENGTIMHGLKFFDNGFTDFGEVYFSTVEQGAIKAWKLHKKMTLNLIVPVGKVLFCFLDARKKSITYKQPFKIILSQTPYFRLTVPSEIWFGFKGLHDGVNMITNIADMPHDPDEVIRKDIEEIGMDWIVK